MPEGPMCARCARFVATAEFDTLEESDRLAWSYSPDGWIEVLPPTALEVAL